MKRDMNLVRAILLAIEASPSGDAPSDLKIEGYAEQQINYHVYVMIEAGLVEGSDVTTFGSPGPEAIASRLTWAGHEFLDAARDDKRWKHALSMVTDCAGSVTIDVLKQLLVAMMRSSLGLS
jgi:hypothetical protein